MYMLLLYNRFFVYWHFYIDLRTS